MPNQTPNQRMTELEEKISSINKRIAHAVEVVKTRFEENPENWESISDLGMLVKCLEDALDDNNA